jgi:peptidoglycan/LPS O-acetylase OafA/YrhL
MSEFKIKDEIILNYIRSLAILSVLIYHYFPVILPRGYLGVDVFFVLSGYLIIKQIYALIKKYNDFKIVLRHYFIRRFRRILPSLLLVSIAIYLFGWFLFPSDDLVKVANYLLESNLFVTNFNLANEVDYFNNSSSFKPALHLWSLSVEVQFYLLAVIIFYYFGYHLYLFIALLSISLFLFINNEMIAFYYLPARLWEFLFGSITYCFINNHKRSIVPSKKYSYELLTLFFLVIIIAALRGVLFDNRYANLFVCIFVSLIIIFQSNKILIYPAIDNVANFFSNSSYAIYLWHWPLYVYGLLYFGDIFDTRLLIVFMFVSVALGYLTTISLEQFSRKYYNSIGRIFNLTALLFLVCLIFYSTIYFNGFESRDIEIKSKPILSVKRAMASTGIEFINGEIINPRIFTGKTSDSVVFMGSSLMSQYYGRVKYLYNQSELPQLTTVYLSINHCTPVSAFNFLKPENFNCSDYYKSAAKIALLPSTKIIVLAANWPNLYNTDLSFNELGVALIRDINLFRSNGKKVVLISNPPHFKGFDPFAVFALYRFDNFSLTELRVDRQRIEVPFLKNQLIEIANLTGASLIDPFDYLCEKEFCSYTKNGIPLYVDEAHISYDFGAEKALFIDEIIKF